jgi:hypothetical protein
LAETTRCEALFSLGALYLVSTGDSSVCGDLTGLWEQSRSFHRKPPMQVKIHEMSAIYRVRGSGVPTVTSDPKPPFQTPTLSRVFKITRRNPIARSVDVSPAGMLASST